MNQSVNKYYSEDAPKYGNNVYIRGRGKFLRSVAQNSQIFLNNNQASVSLLGPAPSSSSSASSFSSLLGSGPAQKRKSPTQLNTANVNTYNNCDKSFEDCEKNMDTGVIVNENSSFMPISFNGVGIGGNMVNNNVPSFTAGMSTNKMPVNSLISSHLRKHANPAPLMQTTCPNLKAQFLRKYENLNFPIGVIINFLSVF